MEESVTFWSVRKGVSCNAHAKQLDIYLNCILKGQSYKEYAEENGIRAQSVQETAKYVKRKAKKFFKKF